MYITIKNWKMLKCKKKKEDLELHPLEVTITAVLMCFKSCTNNWKF